MKKVTKLAIAAIRKFQHDFENDVYSPLYFGWTTVSGQVGKNPKKLPVYVPSDYEEWKQTCRKLITSMLNHYEAQSTELWMFEQNGIMRFSVHIERNERGDTGDVDCSLSITI